MPFDFNGKTYILRCNFNVLADVQEEFGRIPDILEKKMTLRYFASFLAAMMNDYADEMGWPERLTAKQLGRMMPASPDIDLVKKVMELVMNAIYIRDETNTENKPEKKGDGEKN